MKMVTNNAAESVFEAFDEVLEMFGDFEFA